MYVRVWEREREIRIKVMGAEAATCWLLMSRIYRHTNKVARMFGSCEITIKVVKMYCSYTWYKLGLTDGWRFIMPLHISHFHQPILTKNAWTSEPNLCIDVCVTLLPLYIYIYTLNFPQMLALNLNLPYTLINDWDWILINSLYIKIIEANQSYIYIYI